MNRGPTGATTSSGPGRNVIEEELLTIPGSQEGLLHHQM